MKYFIVGVLGGIVSTIWTVFVLIIGLVLGVCINHRANSRGEHDDGESSQVTKWQETNLR